MYSHDYNTLAHLHFKKKVENTVLIIFSIVMFINFLYLIKDIYTLYCLLF